MSFIYHIKPVRMFGDILYPLNTLREINKDIYEFHTSKYIYRKILMEQKIPVLNCLWNDVLHCLPLDLRLIYKALIKTGHHKVGNKEFFKIPIDLLKNIKFVKYKFDKEFFDKERKEYVLTTEDIEPLTIESYRELSELPNKTIEWYKQCAESRRGVPLLFRYIPHIFVKGNIPIKEVDVCDWSN
ncbi:MAG: hypothetical protein JSU83_06130 [Deltaproteobacteria bacterium]|nr:MAG: hypothetical protein JSU83_06130 [Deltaproteobacteria bacterium]